MTKLRKLIRGDWSSTPQKNSGTAYAANEHAQSIEYLHRWVMPRDLIEKDLETYVPPQRHGIDGIAMRTGEQLKKLSGWAEYASTFDALRSDTRINTRCFGKSYLHNDYYPTPDAEIYAAMILDFKPGNIIEIGSGFSTIIARKALELVDYRCSITVIDPEPRTDVKDIADTLISEAIEDVDLSDLQLSDDTLLFIDSSHITRSRGDIPTIYNQLIPVMPTASLVHIHDIFIPFDYPYIYQQRLYTEQYMLQALLCHSDRFQVQFATHNMSRNHGDAMRRILGGVVGVDDLYYGSSFWIAVAGESEN